MVVGIIVVRSLSELPDPVASFDRVVKIAEWDVSVVDEER